MVYFIQCGESGPIKIGNTKVAIEDRIYQIQVNCPFELNLLRVLNGNYTESEIHMRFEEDRIRGEWFKPSQKLISFINKPNKKPKPMKEYKKITKSVEKALLKKFGNDTEIAKQLGITYEHYCLLRRRQLKLSRRLKIIVGLLLTKEG
jgi:hypothetical protein